MLNLFFTWSITRKEFVSDPVIDLYVDIDMTRERGRPLACTNWSYVCLFLQIWFAYFPNRHLEWNHPVYQIEEAGLKSLWRWGRERGRTRLVLRPPAFSKVILMRGRNGGNSQTSKQGQVNKCGKKGGIRCLNIGPSKVATINTVILSSPFPVFIFLGLLLPI